MSFVLDNSVALAWCFEDEHTPGVLDCLTEDGAIVLQLWPGEAMWWAQAPNQGVYA